MPQNNNSKTQGKSPNTHSRQQRTSQPNASLSPMRQFTTNLDQEVAAQPNIGHGLVTASPMIARTLSKNSQSATRLGLKSAHKRQTTGDKGTVSGYIPT